MKKLLALFILPLLVAGSLSPVFTPAASAVTAADWKAGRIIDDSLFTGLDMSVSQIQSFLNSKVPVCDTWGTQPASEYGRSDITHAQYAASRGWPAPPYVCLKNYHEVPKTAPGPGVPANSYGNGGNPPAGSVSAAQMIYNAAQTHRISPKVLLVKLATESAGPLTTDKWPLQKQYTYAMGAHCPDSGPGGSANCDANYAGFSIQISEAAELLRWYLDSMTQSWWQYKKPFTTNSILWNVAPSNCGGSNVYVETMGTAALYTYTPYQPNQAALNNMYGTGNGCSAYGNRNFWRVYNDWFGSSLYPQPMGGSLLYQSSTGAIYLTTDTTRYYIPSMAVLSNYGLDKYGTIAVSDSRIQEFTNGGSLTNLVYDSGNIYMVNNKVRHYVTPAMCTAWSLNCYDANSVKSLGSVFQTQFLGTGSTVPVLMHHSGVTYKMEAGKKLPIANTKTRNDLGLGGVSPLYTSNFNASYPVGGLLVTTPGVISFSPSTSLYYFDGSNYLRIPNMSLFSDWNLSAQPTLPAPISSYNSTPPSSTNLSNWYKSGMQNYIIDRGRRLEIPSTQLGGWQDKTFVEQATSLANSFPKYVLDDFVWSNGTIYLLQDGKKRYVPRYETYLTQKKTSALVDIAKEKLANVPNGEMVLSEGNIVALSDNPQKLYVLMNGKLVWIPNPNVFNSYGFNWGGIIICPPSISSEYPIDNQQPLNNTHVGGVYYLPSAQGMYKLSDSLSIDFGLQRATIPVASQAITRNSASRELSRFLYDTGTGKIYYASGQAIHYVATQSAFVAYGGTKNPVSAVPTSFISQFTLGQSLY